MLRATLAANSHFARALVSAPYAVAINKIVDPQKCSIVAPESRGDVARWALFLRHHTATEWAELSGLLLFHPPMKRALEVMHAKFLAENRAFKLPLPITDQHVELTINVHPKAVTSGTVRASAITRMKRPVWRSPHKTVDKELGGGDGTAPAGTAVDSPFSATGAEVNPLSDPLIHTKQDPDGSSSSSIEHVMADDFPLDVFGGTIERVVKDAMVRFSKPSERGDLTDKGSTGALGDREGGVSRLSVDQTPSVSAPRIAEVLTAFGELQRNGSVQNVGVVGTQNNPGLDREGVPCGRFDQRSNVMPKLAKKQASYATELGDLLTSKRSEYVR